MLRRRTQLRLVRLSVCIFIRAIRLGARGCLTRPNSRRGFLLSRACRITLRNAVSGEALGAPRLVRVLTYMMDRLVRDVPNYVTGVSLVL